VVSGGLDGNTAAGLLPTGRFQVGLQHARPRSVQPDAFFSRIGGTDGSVFLRRRAEAFAGYPSIGADQNEQPRTVGSAH
jgi:hypothetical protein